MNIKNPHHLNPWIGILLFVILLCRAGSLSGAPESVDSGKTGNPIKDMYLESPYVFIHPDIPAGYSVGVRKWQGIPGLERAPNGRLWATWYSGGSGEGRDNYVLLVSSDDDGKTWSEPRLIVEPRTKHVRAFDPVLWLDPQNRLWLFWAQGYQQSDVNFHDYTEYKQEAGVWAVKTDTPDDIKAAWSEPVRLCDGIMMNKPFVRYNGDWLLPASIWAIKKIKPTDPAPEVTGANVIVSSDQGKTFSYRGRALMPRARSFDEHMFTEDGDGKLRMWIRSTIGIAESVSTDDGGTWSAPQIRRELSPVGSRFFIRRLQSGNLLLVANKPPEGSKRTHLTAFISEDNGTTWKGGLLLDERGDGSGVSYPDGIEGGDGVIRIIYDLDRDVTGRIYMAAFTEKDVAEGAFNSAQARAKLLISKLRDAAAPKAE